MESVKHQIEYKRLDEIRPYDNNPRRNDEAAKAVANSIKEFGFQSPIIVDRDGVIIAGQGRCDHRWTHPVQGRPEAQVAGSAGHRSRRARPGKG